MDLLNRVQALSFPEQQQFLHEVFVHYEKQELIGLLDQLDEQQLSMLVVLLFCHDDEKKQLIMQQIDEDILATSEHIKQLAQQSFQLHYQIKEMTEKYTDDDILAQLELKM